MIPKCMTLNDAEWLFHVIFAPIRLAETVRLQEMVACKLTKNVKDRHTLSGRDSSFWQYKVCADIRLGSLERIC